jgi:hypothetical protein
MLDAIDDAVLRHEQYQEVKDDPKLDHEQYQVVTALDEQSTSRLLT